MTNPTETPTTTTATEPAPRRRLLLPIALGVGALLAAGAITVGGFAVAAEFADDNDDDRTPVASTGAPSDAATDPIVDRDDQVTDEEAREVTEAAIAAAGGGTVTDIDRSDDPGEAWEVEVLLENGDEVDVELAADYSVLRVDIDPRS